MVLLQHVHGDGELLTATKHPWAARRAAMLALRAAQRRHPCLRSPSGHVSSYYPRPSRRCALPAASQPDARSAGVRDPPATALALVSPSLTQSNPSSPLKACFSHGPSLITAAGSLASILLALFLLPLVASIPSLVTPLASPPPPTLAIPRPLLSSRQRYTHFCVCNPFE